MAEIVNALTTALVGSQLKRDVARATRKPTGRRMVMFPAKRRARRMRIPPFLRRR